VIVAWSLEFGVVDVGSDLRSVKLIALVAAFNWASAYEVRVSSVESSVASFVAFVHSVDSMVGVAAVDVVAHLSGGGSAIVRVDAASTLGEWAVAGVDSSLGCTKTKKWPCCLEWGKR
jgi:hypothetical protein